MKKLIKIIVFFLLILLVLTLSFGYFLASSIANPKVLSFDEEIKWEKEHNIWGNFESYELNDYTIKGKDNYIFHCDLIKAKKPNNK